MNGWNKRDRATDGQDAGSGDLVSRDITGSRGQIRRFVYVGERRAGLLQHMAGRERLNRVISVARIAGDSIQYRTSCGDAKRVTSDIGVGKRDRLDEHYVWEVTSKMVMTDGISGIVERSRHVEYGVVPKRTSGQCCSQVSSSKERTRGKLYNFCNTLTSKFDWKFPF